MNKMIAVLSVAFALPAGAQQISAPAAVPVPSSAESVVSQALAANAQLSAIVANAKGALPETKDLMRRVDESSRELAVFQKDLDDIQAGINVPRPDPSGKADYMMDVMQMAEDAADRAQPDGHSLADTYDPLLARVMEYDPYGDAAVADAAFVASQANVLRALFELRKQAYSLGYELRYRLNDTELGDRDLRGFNYDMNMSEGSRRFDDLKRALELKKSEKGAPADYVQKLQRIEDLAVFAQPRSA